MLRTYLHVTQDRFQITKSLVRSATMDGQIVATIEGVTLARRGYYIVGTLVLASSHLVFSFIPPNADTLTPREIWICYPIIERISKFRGSSWIKSNGNGLRDGLAGVGNGAQSYRPQYTHLSQSTHLGASASTNSELAVEASTGENKKEAGISASTSSLGVASVELSSNIPTTNPQLDHYSASHIRIQCRDFTYYLFDFTNDNICNDVFQQLSYQITLPRAKNDILLFYAFSYQKNMLEMGLKVNGWDLYNAREEYIRLGLNSSFWRISDINENYSFCPLYPNQFVVPKVISDNILKHAGKFRSKQRIPAVVYRHRVGYNYNVIARCAQPLVGLKLQNRSLQDEKLIGEIFQGQQHERINAIEGRDGDQDISRDINRDQPQRNLLLDLRPLPNAMAQHALGAGTENIENYRGKKDGDDELATCQVDKIFCNLDNIHVMRDSLNKLNTILNDLDRHPIKPDDKGAYALLQQNLTKTQWLYRLSLILQSVDRITKSVHLNNTNVLIHCSDGWDRTLQVLALLQLCLDPYYRTMKGFAVLVEKEWVSFGFKFNLRADHGGCIGAKYLKGTDVKVGTDCPLAEPETVSSVNETTLESSFLSSLLSEQQLAAANNSKKAVLSFILRAATHIKNTAVSAQQVISSDDFDDNSHSLYSYSGNSEKSPIFHQFLDSVYQLLRQHPNSFEFNSRFLKRLFYHHYLCQYGTFMCNSERELIMEGVKDSTVSVWDYFFSRTGEFINSSYHPDKDLQENDGILFFNYSDLKWWFELYGRSDQEMNGLSNSLDKKFAKMMMK